MLYHRSFYLLTLAFFLALKPFAQGRAITIVTEDVHHFWEAYDRITLCADSAERIALLNDLYLQKGTDGLKALTEARHYEAQEWMDAIMGYPSYWKSIRKNTDLLLRDKDRMQNYFDQLQAIYPELKPATVYFAVGAFRSAGTYKKDNVLFGAEFILAQSDADTHELPERLQKIIDDYAPYNIPLIALHELIHTQQKEGWESLSIVHQCVAEGVAEFISTLLSGEKLGPNVAFGKNNETRVMGQFMHECVRDNDVFNWLWSENTNALKEPDLGYYIGYEVCERYYQKAADKRKAIKELIELDYHSDEAFAKVLDGSGFLPLTWEQIGQRYEELRPRVKRIIEFENGSQQVNPNVQTLTIEFTEVMSTCCQSMDYDEALGSEPLSIAQRLGFSDDGMRYTFALKPLKPNTSYHLIISNMAKQDGGNRLLPYAVEFRTGE